MRGALKAVLMLACALGLAACMAETRIGVKQGSKHGRILCSQCHKSDAQAPNPLKAPEIELCVKCHPRRGSVGEHAIGIKPKDAVKTLPLRDGLVQCSTCHDPHGNVSHRYLLRIPSKDLCSACHQK